MINLGYGYMGRPHFQPFLANLNLIPEIKYVSV